uniref:Polygalacturonase n=1 Tax=Ananas comosus var. bracteatus TaxID=296719 RepID=A0A6V7NEL6_ANACO|nr:unnamed protein product [Ananas comosus var. bracteatus]
MFRKGNGLRSFNLTKPPHSLLGERRRHNRDSGIISVAYCRPTAVVRTRNRPPWRATRSLINGHNLTDVVITGNNGVIDGQGSIWWEWFRSRKLNYSRPHLVEFTDSQDIVISNLSFLNSPAWSIHPVYCSNVIVQNITIQTSPDSPFTDGIVPDSSSNMCIEDCSISVGHDAIALKSGWDGYGISYARPTTEIQITKVALQSAAGAALAFGSEMSGGISDVRAEQLYIYNSSTGVSFRTTLGRGGFVEKTVISNSVLENVREAIRFDGHSGGHPDDHYDPSEIPIIRKITLKSIVGSNISVAGTFQASKTIPSRLSASPISILR